MIGGVMTQPYRDIPVLTIVWENDKIRQMEVVL